MARGCSRAAGRSDGGPVPNWRHTPSAADDRFGGVSRLALQGSREQAVERGAFVAAQRAEDFVLDAFERAVRAFERLPSLPSEDDDVSPPVGRVAPPLDETGRLQRV